MVDTALVRTIVGICGNVISFLLFISPTPTFVKITRSKSVQGYKPDPYLATVMNCGVWFLYGLPFIHEDNILVLSTNSVGFIIETAFLLIYFIFADNLKRKKMTIVLLIEFIIWAIVFIITMVVFHSLKSRSLFVGIIALVFNILMYASPLTVMRQVIRTKSVKYMPFFLSLANLTNGVIWTAYSLLKFDLFILIPNAIGTLSGVIQLFLYATFYRTTKWNDVVDQKQNQISRSNHGIELPSTINPTATNVPPLSLV